MIIRGNTVSTNMPRADYGQTDPAQASFILNKPDTAIEKAQATADAAKATANAALPKAGGEMTGPIDLGGNAVTNLADPQNPGDGVNLRSMQELVASKHFFGQAVLLASGWSAEAPYTLTVEVAGILATDQPHYGAVYSEDLETALAQKEAFAMVDELDTADGSVTFTCFEDKPEVDIPIQMEVNR